MTKTMIGYQRKTTTSRISHVTTRDLVYDRADETTDQQFITYQLPTTYLPNDIPTNEEKWYIRTLIHVLRF